MVVTASPSHDARTKRLRVAASASVLPAVSLFVFIAYNMRIQADFPTLVNLRWLMLALLAGAGLLMIWHAGGSLPIGATHLGLTLFSIITLISASYSIVPLFSLSKAIAFALGMVALVFGLGLRYMRDPNAWLWLLAGGNATVLALTALSLPFATSYDRGALQGLFANPNSLGSVLALTFPAVLWVRERLRLSGGPPLRRALVTSAIAANCLFIYMSRSRASLAVLALVLVLYSVLRRSWLAGAVALLIGLATLAAPSVAGEIANEAIFNGGSGLSAFASRIDQFHDTLDAAKSRPISGYGFGTSRGETSWDGSLSSLSVGREKANAYVAAVEEVGLMGAACLWFSVAAALIAGYRKSRRTGDPAIVALLMVVAAGALHTNFEAWLMSIGSFEAFIFWATMGVMLYASAEPAPRVLASR